MTNAEKIRSMTDEELMEFLCRVQGDCVYCPKVGTCPCVPEGNGTNPWIDWLRSEVD